MHTLMDRKIQIRGKLEIAKRYQNHEDRKWLYVGNVDSYGSEDERVEFYVLEGSPPRGFIIALPNRGEIYRLDGRGKLRKTFYAYDDEDIS